MAEPPTKTPASPALPGGAAPPNGGAGSSTSGAAEPRALTAALSGPAFQTKNSGSAMHAATRHVERWAPEAGANRVRSLRNLGFVDRLVAPWLEVAQKSASLRLFQQYRSEGMAERETSHVSWVFPRPWYQDELDWMTASREAAARTVQQQQAAPTMFTTRGTFVAPAQRQDVALPGSLYEHVAPSLSITPPARNDFAMPAALAAPAGPRIHDAYSPLVPFAAVNAAQLMQRAVAPLIGTSDRSAGVAAMSPGLRSVLTTMLERSVMPSSAIEPTRTAAHAPELVTPPAPRPELAGDAAPGPSSASSVVEDVGAQRVQIAELQRAARVVAERQLAERTQQQGAQQVQARAQQEAAQAQAAERQRTADAASTQATSSERARVEDRIAQRMAERQAQVAAQTAAQTAQVVQTQQRAREQRLHEAAREAAARDASVAPTATASEAPAQAIEQRRAVPQEITAALANLSPQLASVVATNLAQHPERMAQTIGELGEALRNAELIARNAAAGGSFEQTRGPRLVMPAGLGGLVATVDRNVAQSERRAQGLPFAPTETVAPRAQMSAMPMIAPRPTFAPATAAGAQMMSASAMRMPAIAWLAAPGSPAAHQASEAGDTQGMPSGALAATVAARPMSLQHVAWADRWLARFSGAKEASLDLLTASSASPATRLQALADAAPGTVFVAPQLDHSIDDSPAAVARREAEAPVYAPPVRRYDDNEATPDDVLVAISRQAARSRTPVASVPELVTADRPSLADAVAHTVPVAPSAGLSAQLASSPFAPAFRHVFPLAAAPTFDVRALFGETLSAAYLAGMLTPAAREVVGGAAIGELPGFATIAAATPFAPIAREVIDFAAEYVAPAPELAADASPEAIAESQQYYAAQQQAQQAAQAIEPLTTMRSALLSWNVESIVTPQASAPAMAQAHTPYTHELRADMPTLASSAMTAVSPEMFAAYVGGTSAAVPAGSIGQTMLSAMSEPMVGESTNAQPGIIESAGGETRVPTFAAPGMIADRAQTWSVAQERSAADLSFDFVTPELVLAARVYGLGPAEAAQAMRLAIAGPSQLAAMASTVNRTFVQAMAIEAARGEQGRPDHGGAMPSGATAPITAYPSAMSPAMTAAASAGTSTGTIAGPFALPTASATFGVARKTPRGAFMWPSATVAALGLSAAAPDGDQGMPVAALELLAAQSVAALGTYAALGFHAPASFGEMTSEAAPAPSSIASVSAGAPAMTSLAPAGFAAEPAATGGEPSETDVLTSASAMVSTSRRAKFEAMYLALGQTAQSRTWSPAARAARALALAGRGDESITALERAQIAWSVLPLVAPTAMSAAFGNTADEPGAVQSTGTQLQRAAMRRHVELQQEQLFAVESRPGLANLSSRAGEALGSYVAPSGPEAKSSSSSSGGGARDREQGAVMRAPSAAPDYVRTGSVGGVRSTGRFGGGEVEVPTWFEAAARKMLDDRSSGMSGDISLAELTLVQSAPTTHIAASERGVQSAAPAVANPSSTGAQQSANQQIDIEKVANEVYKHILTLMDAARARNGEPYL